MPNTAATPGPWESMEIGPKINIAAGVWAIASMPKNAKNAVGNARLMAAAPELRDAIKALLAHIDLIDPVIGTAPPDALGDYDVLIEARALLARLEG